MRLKLDENLGRLAAQMLREDGHDVSTVAEQGMSGAVDRLVIERCRQEGRCLVTLDRGFGNPLLYRPSRFPGIAVLRLSKRQTSNELEDGVRTLIGGLRRESIGGRLWIVERGRIREHQEEEDDDDG